MKRIFGLLIVLTLAAVPAFAQKVNIDYAHDFDFDAVKTFSYVETSDSNAENPLMDSRIRDAIIRELEEGGLKLVESDPDLFVTYHITTQENTTYTTTSFGYGGYHGGWGGYGRYGYGYPYGGGVTSSTTTPRTYTEGTLIIDAYDSTEKKMIWRGTGTVTVKDAPEKQSKQVDKILAKLGKRWDKIVAGKGK
jgi:hypothetical protein